MRHLPGERLPKERRVEPARTPVRAIDDPLRLRIKDAHIGGGAEAEVAGVDAEDFRRGAGQEGEGVAQFDLVFVRETQGERQQCFQSGDARLGFRERRQLGIRFVRLVIGADRGDDTVLDRPAQGVAVFL